MIAITGSTGFVGSHLLVELMKRGKEVIAFKRETSDVSYTQKVFELHDALHLFHQIRWRNCHLSKYSEVVEALNGVDVVIHAAAQVNLNETGNKGMIEKNIKITENVVNACILQHVKRFCYISSIATITHSIDGVGKENSPFEILTTEHPYTVSKCYAELEVWRGIQEGLPGFIINPSVILGYSRQWQIFELMISQLQKGFYYYPSGRGSFVDIRDIVRIILHITFHTSITNQRFIVTAENVYYKDFYKYLCECLGISQELKPISKEKLLMLGYLGELMSVVSKKRLMNRYTARLLNKELNYSNEKICDVLNYQFISVKESIQYLYSIYEKINATSYIT
ncbi:MAG: NAD-dependent epimerase/dehydratase family protein [Bacteroidales bacterium]|nr:NAD-dependent epimerase/dehydratase family protein [Bacteroidales bacterium]